MTMDLALDDAAAGVAGRTVWGEPFHRRDDLLPTPDLLVVGAGAAGLAVASAAVAAGVGRVQVVDRGPIAGGATSRNAGALIPDVHALTADPAEAALGRHSLALHREAAERLGYPLRAIDWLAVLPNRPTDDRLRDSRARWLASPEEVDEATGGAVTADSGALVPDQAATDPLALVTALAATVPHVRTGTAVTRLRVAPQLEVETTEGTVRPGAVVVATGTVPSGWLPTRRRFVTGHLVLTAPVDRYPTTLAASRQVVVVPRSDGRLLVGGTRDGQQSGEVDDAVVARIRRELAALIPAARDVEFERVWTGQRPVVDDDLPLVDEVAANVFVVGGLFHTGVLTCLAAAEGVVARLQDGAFPAGFAAFRRRT